MKKLHKIIFISLVAAISSNAVNANILDNEIVVIPLVITAGGVVSANPALSAALDAVFNSALLVATTAISYEVSKNASEKKILQAKVIIIKEVVDYQTTGEIGLALNAGVRAIKEKNSELSDAEAVDALLEALLN